MDIAFQILLKLASLYLTIAVGYIAVRHLKVDREGISKLLFYVIVPIVFVHGISHMRLSGEILLLPPLIFAVSCGLCLAMYALAGRHWGDNTRTILAFCSGNGNIGYFGLPVALLLFDAQTVAVYMVMIIGLMFYEGTLGYYILTRGQFTSRQALRKIVTLPMLHGALLGLLLSLLDTPTPAFMEEFFQAMRGTYTILGMMLVGMGLAGLKNFRIDWPFMAATFAVKFIAWPLTLGAFIWLDMHWLHLFTPAIHHAMLLFSFVPLAVNAVILATLFNAQPEKMAAAVFASTFFALLYVPVMVAVFVL